MTPSGSPATGDGAAVLADEHEHGAEYNFAAVFGGGPGAQLFAFTDLGDFAQAHRHALAMRDDDVVQFLDRANLSRHANQVLLTATFDIAGARVGIAARNRVHHISQAEAKSNQSGGIGRDVDLTDVAADRVHFGDAFQMPQLRSDHPVLQRAQIGRCPRRTIGFQRAWLGLDGVHEDFAEAGCDRPERRVDTRWQLAFRLLQSFRDLLTCKIDVGAVVEYGGHLRQPVARDRARVVEFGQPGECRFDRIGQALLGLERRITWCL